MDSHMVYKEVWQVKYCIKPFELHKIEEVYQLIPILKSHEQFFQFGMKIENEWIKIHSK